MVTPILWYLLAGFVLGFAISTLWEWLYYRGVRQRRAATMVTDQQAAAAAPVDEHAPAGQTDYRSPAIFIEGERAPNDGAAATLIPSYEPITPRTPATEANATTGTERAEDAAIEPADEPDGAAVATTPDEPAPGTTNARGGTDEL